MVYAETSSTLAIVQDWRWDPTLFAGAAAHYDRGRLPYAPRLAEALRTALVLDGRGRLLDVGCGPGSVTLPFAPLFEEAVGVDADGDMLEEAARLARERNVRNCRWLHRRAEELPDLGVFRVATFAASFHWMDRSRVAEIVHGMLERDGALVHVDNRHQEGTIPPPDAPHPPVPDDAIEELKRRYLGIARRAGQGTIESTPGNEAAVLSTRFEFAERVIVRDGRVLERTIDDVIAGRLSSSSSAPHLFGDSLADFVGDLRRILAEASPSGRFSVRLPDNHLNVWHPRG